MPAKNEGNEDFVASLCGIEFAAKTSATFTRFRTAHKQARIGRRAWTDRKRDG